MATRSGCAAKRGSVRHAGRSRTRHTASYSASLRTLSASQRTLPTDQVVAGYLLTFFGGYLLVAAVIIYARSVADGIAEEKSSRVMEVLLNAATPWQLMVGKILGVGAAGFTQMAALVVVGIGALLLQTPLQAALFGTAAGGFTPHCPGSSRQA